MSLRIFNTRFWLPALLAATLTATAQTPFMVSDFEDRVAGNKLSAYSFWEFSTDADSHGNSVITSGDTAASPAAIDSSSFASPGYGGSLSCLKMAYKYGSIRPHGDAPDTSSYDPEVGLVTQVYDESSNVGADFTGATKVTFWARADKSTKIRLAAATPEVLDYAYWGDDFTITTAWKQYSLDFKAKTFAQPEWAAAAVPFNIAKITEFIFVMSQANNPGPGGTFYLDDFAVADWAPKVAEDPTSLRPAAAAEMRGLLLSEGGASAKIALPARYRNGQGTVEVFGIAGARLGAAAYAKGDREVSVALRQSARGGLFFYRVHPSVR